MSYDDIMIIWVITIMIWVLSITVFNMSSIVNINSFLILAQEETEVQKSKSNLAETCSYQWES